MATIPNRGYSLGFHDGRLSHHAHNFEDTHTLSAWEYAGMIVDVTEDAFLLAVKNRMEMGDVLEFVPHTRRAPLLLRIYEFEDTRSGRIFAEEGINAGQKPVIRIPFAWFHEENDVEQLRKDFPVHTVVRKEQALTEDALGAPRPRPRRRGRRARRGAGRTPISGGGRNWWTRWPPSMKA